MSKNDSPAMNKKDSTVKKRGAATKKKKYTVKKKKRDTAKKSEVMTKKRKLDGGVHGGPLTSSVCLFSCTSYISYTHTNDRNRVAMIEQGKNDLGLRERGSGSQPKERRREERSCGSDYKRLKSGQKTDNFTLVREKTEPNYLIKGNLSIHVSSTSVPNGADNTKINV
ncbi:hypothetical protein YC2023_060273 [Brassica napus]